MKSNKAGADKRVLNSSLPVGELQIIDESCRRVLLLLFLPAALWLLLSSVFSLLSSIKFHSPLFLATEAWLTYGRTRPAFFNALIYGFCIPSALGVTLWLFARLGRVTLVHGWLAVIGAISWNFGVAVGLAGILLGDSTGHEHVEMPVYSAPMLLSGYLLMGLSAALTFHNRKVRPLFVSQWLLFAALFWFPWIYSTAQLLISVFPSRGIVQSIIAWWYANNLMSFWMWLIGLALLFYFIPALLTRELVSRHLSLFAFWTILLFSPWGGIPVGAPVPAWIPVLSTTATLLLIIPLLAVALILFRSTTGALSQLWRNSVGKFMLTGSLFFLISAFMQVLMSWPQFGHSLGLSWFSYAQNQFAFYGFFVLVLFGAAYYILPLVSGLQTKPPADLTFWLALMGILLAAFPLALAGVKEAHLLANSRSPFIEVMESTVMFLRISTLGELLIAGANLVFFLFVLRSVFEGLRVRAATGYAAATKDLLAPTGAKTT